MTPTTFLELIVSLSVQVTIVIATAAWIATRRKLEGEAPRVWAACHFLILALVTMAILVPHLRLFPSGPVSLIASSFAEPSQTTSLSSQFGMLLFFLWLVGAMLGLIALLLGMLHAVRVLHVSKPFIALETNAVVSEKEEVIQLVTSPLTSRAFCWQFHKPYIVLPDSMQDFPADELQGILRHEKAHLEAGHPLHLFLQRLVEILFWFHPLVWWASRQAAWSREFHCDAMAVTTAQEAASYLRGLLRLTEQRVGANLGLPAGLNFASNVSLVRRRADRIASRDWSYPPVQRQFTLAVVPLIACFALCLGVWLPVNEEASHRTVWSPWPKWSATALHELGVTVRDYEIDGHRLRPHELLERHQH